MGNRAVIESHLKQACINEELATYLKKQCHNEIFLNWAFVGIFYAALHYFTAFCQEKNITMPKHHAGDDGAVELARKNFFTTKNSITDSAVGDYPVLLQWSHDVRYTPHKASLLGKENLKIAWGYLERIKLITFNETGLVAVKSGTSNSISIRTAKQKYLEHLYRMSKDRSK